MSNISVSKLKNFIGHRDCIYSLEKSGQPNLVFSSGGDGLVVAWDLSGGDDGKLIAQLPNSVYSLHFYQEENWLIIGQNFAGIHVIDLNTQKEIGTLKLLNTAIFDIQSCGNLIYVGHGDGTVVVVDIVALKIVHRFKLSHKSARTLAIHRERNELGIGYSDHEVRIVDLSDYRVKNIITGHKNSVFSIKYSPDYRYLLTGSRDAHLKVWDVTSEYDAVNNIVAHMFAINHIDYSPDEKYFVTCSMDKSIKIWDGEIFKLIKVIDKSRHAGHGTSVNKLLWTSFNNLLLSASDDKSIAVWEININ